MPVFGPRMPLRRWSRVPGLRKSEYSYRPQCSIIAERGPGQPSPGRGV